MNKHKYLFLGGPRDGQVLSVDDDAYQLVVVRDEVEADYFDIATARIMPTQSTDVYVRTDVYMFNRRLRVFTHQDLSPVARNQRAAHFLMTNLAKDLVA